eukprot:GILI01036550.1.p1 GENE.GILI01036550.1~~GILI01036550.1.p1  ORF type:complete len:179 (-),score=18.99 GILI01036550.1:63-599(-)
MPIGINSPLIFAKTAPPSTSTSDEKKLTYKPFPPSGHETNGATLSFMLAHGKYLGKTGPAFSHGANYGNGSEECLTSGYEPCQYLFTTLEVNEFAWVRISPEDIGADRRPMGHLTAKGYEHLTLIRAIRRDGGVHPGVWEEGLYPTYCWGGLNRHILEVTTDHHIEVLCYQPDNAFDK